MKPIKPLLEADKIIKKAAINQTKILELFFLYMEIAKNEKQIVAKLNWLGSVKNPLYLGKNS
jgi:hypothetical protein